MKQKMKLEKASGSVLIFTLIMMFMLLALALGVMSTTAIERKLGGATGKSVVAFQVADSGAEAVLNVLKKQPPSTSLSTAFQTGFNLNCSTSPNYVTNNLSSGNYTITFLKEDGSNVGCGESIFNVFQIKSVGMYSGASRAVQVAVAADFWTLQPNNSANILSTNSGNVGIGTTNPADLLEVGNSSTVNNRITVTNINSGATSAQFVARNENTDVSAGAARVGVTSTGYTTNGGFVQDAGFVDAGNNLSGGLSILARANVSTAPIRFYTGGSSSANERMRITSDGMVGIGNTDPLIATGDLTLTRIGTQTGALFLGTRANYGYLYYNGTEMEMNKNLNLAGCLKINGTPQTGGCLSDSRLKKNIAYLSGTLDKITLLKPSSFNFIDPKNGSGTQYGLIAQDVEEVFPELVKTNESGYKTVYYGLELQMYTIQAVKELKAKNDELKNEISQLKALVCLDHPNSDYCKR